MRRIDQFLEDIDDLANRVHDLPVPAQAHDRIAALIEEITDILEDQDQLRSTDWEA
jgi:hypothetical protein